MSKIKNILSLTKIFLRNTVVGLIPILIIWYFLIYIIGIEENTVPIPTNVFSTLVKNWAVLFEKSKITIITGLVSFILAVLGGTVLGILTQKSLMFSKFMVPSIIVSQVLPKAALIPLLLILFRNIYVPPIIVAVIIGFFPIYSSTIVSLNTIPDSWKLFYNYNGFDKKQIFKLIETPHIIKNIMPSIKTCLLYVFIGIITSEVIITDKGIGGVISSSYNNLNSNMLYASIIIASLISGFVLYIFEIILIILFDYRKWEIKTLYQ